MRAWCNGSLIDPESPAIAVLDHGFTVGDGVFEAIKVVENVPFALTRHLDRLAFSAKGLGLSPPADAQVREAVGAVLDGQSLTFGRIRITYTAGIAPLGSGRGSSNPTLVVVAAEAKPMPATAKVVVVPWPRNEHGAVVGLKTTSYAENVVALAYAAERDAAEAIFANTAGNLCEGTGTNVFCVFGDDVATPPLSAGCLAGVTRNLVVEWCDVTERDISMEEFAEADEVFLTSTTRDVQSIHTVGNRVMPLATPVTDRVAAVWRTREPQDVDP
jgi:branched-chain amino acid aminotransferase